MHDLVHRPATKVTSWPIYFCRGYNFHTLDHGKDRSTFNYGVCVKGTSDLTEESECYGIIKQIFELYYPGVVGLRIVLFRCDWYDSTMDKGVRINRSGIVDVNRSRRYGKYDPFIFASQADQVCFISYPRLSQKNSDWYATMKMQPRGKVICSEELDPSPLQYESDNTVIVADPFITVDDLADQQEQFVNLHDVLDEELDSEQDDEVSQDSQSTEDSSDF